MTAFIAAIAIIVGAALVVGTITLYRQDQRIDDLRITVADTQRQLTQAIKILTELNAGTNPLTTAATPPPGGAITRPVAGPTIGGRARQRRNQRAS